MPELPEVETIKRTLNIELKGKKILAAQVNYAPIIAEPSVEEFTKQIANKTIQDMKRLGKWLIFDLDDYVLLSHLRMEGRYLFREVEEPILKHEHVVFTLDDGRSFRYQDTRKFGRMYLLKKEEAYIRPPLSLLGLEPWDEKLTVTYLKDKLKNKTIPIKSALLDQTIITGIGNIYDNEILFLSKIRPTKRANHLTKKELECIIENTKNVLREAIELGGTTIRSYHPKEGVNGLFAQKLYVHRKEGEPCSICGNPIQKKFIQGRSSYYCSHCQK
ncbi:MAG: DNA-formamidopyrimidine glycosylase [Firmicutes bacterium]|nr:DNA-formamidopyrimidine glycosylase [Bacillota bacterium]